MILADVSRGVDLKSSRWLRIGSIHVDLATWIKGDIPVDVNAGGRDGFDLGRTRVVPGGAVGPDLRNIDLATKRDIASKLIAGACPKNNVIKNDRAAHVGEIIQPWGYNF